MEASNADLASQCLADKKALLDLREELVKEKMGADKLANQLEQVNSQLLALKDANVTKVDMFFSNFNYQYHYISSIPCY